MGRKEIFNFLWPSLSSFDAYTTENANHNFDGGKYADDYKTFRKHFSDCHADFDNLGVFDNYPGGANSEVVVTSSTIVNNRAASNGGGIRSSNSVGDTPTSIRNTIVANNIANGGTTQDMLNPVISQGYNLIRNTTGTRITGTATGNLTGVDPLLGHLSNNVGPTRTQALRPGSPAIDAGDPTTFPATDQRGIARPQDGDGNGSARADIGAYERRPVDITPAGPFDFDGDGKADIAVFRPSSGVWYELSSTAGFYALQFGLTTGLPVKADYDGDGKTDIAVFRPSNGTWYLQQSNSGLSFPQFGQNGDRRTAVWSEQ